MSLLKSHQGALLTLGQDSVFILLLKWFDCCKITLTNLPAGRLIPVSKALATMIIEDLSPASAACSRYLKPFILFPALSCEQDTFVRTRRKSNQVKNTKQITQCMVPPALCLAIYDEAAADSTVPRQ